MPDGQIRWQQWTNRAIFDEQGHLSEFQAVGRDITEQRQTRGLLMRHAQEMAMLYKTSLEINSQLDVSKLLPAIVQRAAKLVGTYMGGLYLIKPDSQTLELVVSHNLPSDYRGVTLCLGEGLAGRVAQTGKPMVIDDYRHWEGRAAAYASASFRRVLGVPLQMGDKVIGVITINDDIRTGPFDEDEIRLVSLFADQAAIAIKNAGQYQAEREQRELAETLRAVGATLVSTLDTNIVLDRILEQVSRVTPNDVADIMLIKGDSAHFAGWRGYERFGTLDLYSVTFLVATTRNLQHMVETGEPVVIHDIHADPCWIHVPGTERLRSYAGAPIRARGETIGFLAVQSITPGHFEWTDAQRLRAFADQTAIALENARLFEDARTTAKRLQTLSHRMVEVQEAERRSIARELHDEIGQTLTAVKINLQAMQRSPDVSAQASILEENICIVERALQQVRNLSLDLRPSLLDDLGLVPALRWYVNRQAEWAGFTAVFMADSLDAHLPPDLGIACFRVVQEALTNVSRHARAQHVLVELRRCDTELALTIRDDGVGFDVQSALKRAAHGASLGLLGMEERVALVGGKMEIESVPMHGTEIRARFPLIWLPPKAEGSPLG
jgi:signal transduction histidine kinase